MIELMVNVAVVLFALGFLAVVLSVLLGLAVQLLDRRISR